MISLHRSCDASLCELPRRAALMLGLREESSDRQSYLPKDRRLGLKVIVLDFTFPKLGLKCITHFPFNLFVSKKLFKEPRKEKVCLEVQFKARNLNLNPGSNIILSTFHTQWSMSEIKGHFVTVQLE